MRKYNCNTLRILPLLLVMLAGVAAVMDAGNSRQQKKALAEKARYYYIEGQRLSAEGKDPEAYENFKRAWQIDPSYEEAAWEYGNNRLMMRIDTLGSPEEMRRSLDLMRAFVDKYPDNYGELEFYGYCLAQLSYTEEALEIYKKILNHHPERTLNLIQLAQIYMTLDSLEPAIDALNRYEEIEGKDTKLTLRKVGYLTYSGDTLRSLEEFDRLISAKPMDVMPLLLKSDYLRRVCGADSGAQYLFRAEEIAPDNGAVKVALANYYKDLGDSVKYDEMIYQSLLAEDLDADSKIATLADYLQTLLTDKATMERGNHLFEVLLREYPHEPRIHHLSARYNMIRGKKDKALEDMQYVVDLAADNGEYWEELMSYQLSDSLAGKVRETYTAARRHTGATSLMKRMVAQSYMMQDSLPQAIGMYEEILADTVPGFIYPESLDDKEMLRRLDYDRLLAVSDIILDMGVIYSMRKDTTAAEKLYQDALRLNPDNAMAANNLAYSLLETHPDSLEEAERLSKIAITQQPDNATFLDTYAWVLFKMKKYPEALEYQQKVVDALPDYEQSSEIYDHYGDILYMNQRPEEAVRQWEKALELNPGDAKLRRKIKQKSPIF